MRWEVAVDADRLAVGRGNAIGTIHLGIAASVATDGSAQSFAPAAAAIAVVGKMQHLADHDAVGSAIDKVVEARIAWHLRVAVVAERSHAAIPREASISRLRPTGRGVGPRFVPAIAVLVGTAAAKVHAIVALVERSEVVSAVGIDGSRRRGVAGALINLDRRAGHLPLRCGSVAEAVIPQVEQGFLFDLWHDRDGPSSA